MTTDERARRIERVPAALLEATRALLWVRTTADARQSAEQLVHRLGGDVVSASASDVHALPVDISFGDGPPIVVSARPGTEARALLEDHLAQFVADARRALQMSALAEHLIEDAATDRVTRLPNRRTLDRALGRLGPDDTVVIIDLDLFKDVNDGFGHQVGDQVLHAFGAALQSEVRGRDSVGRFGGEEFVVIVSSPNGADAFLRRLRARWMADRPLPVTFSAGIARSAGTPKATLRRADEALYRAKAAGRDRWLWAELGESDPDDVGEPPSRFVVPYLDAAVRGERHSAIRTCLDLLEHDITYDRVIDELLAPAQREVGERWHRNQMTVADEHIVTGVSGAALDALVREATPLSGEGQTVVVCAEGDWHSLAAQMFAESLHAHGLGVTVLGASTPARHVADLLARRRADALAISCSLPMFFPGVRRLIDIAHDEGIPVIVGGRAFGSTGERAQRLGADAWARRARDAAGILRRWRVAPPQLATPTPLVPIVMDLLARADEIAADAHADLVARFPPMADYDDEQMARTTEDMVCNVRFLAAAMLVRDDTVFTDYLRWLQSLLLHRGVPSTALPAGLAALGVRLGHDRECVRLLQLGERELRA